MNTHPPSSRIPFWAFLIFLAVFAAGRLLLPFANSIEMDTHTAIAEAMRHSENWGRQALVCSPDHPTLPTLAILIINLIAQPLHLNPGHLLAALCQGTLLWVAASAFPGWRRWLVLAGLGAFAAGFPELRQAFLSPAPAWLAATLTAIFLAAASEWHRNYAFRDIVGSAIAAALLCLCGLSGMALALTGLVTLGWSILHERYDRGTREGLVFVLWLPAAYAIALILHWNWLVMGDLFYHFRPFATCLSSGAATIAEATTVLRQLGLLALGTWAALLFTAGRRNGRSVLIAAMVLLIGSVATLATAWIGFASLETVAVLPLAAGLAALLLHAGAEWDRFDTFRRLGPPLLLACFAIIAIQARRPAIASPRLGEEAPTSTELTTIVDSRWQDSRIYVTGIRATCLYPDPAQHRFLPLVDERIGAIFEHAKVEQLHVLIPPDDGRFYRPGSAFARYHDQGHPALLLEKEWTSGWQLWRCVYHPGGHSPVEEL